MSYSSSFSPITCKVQWLCIKPENLKIMNMKWKYFESLYFESRWNEQLLTVRKSSKSSTPEPSSILLIMSWTCEQVKKWYWWTLYIVLGWKLANQVTSTSDGFCPSLNFSQLFKFGQLFMFFSSFSMASDGFWSIKVTSTSVGFWPALLSANWSSCTGKTKRDKCQVESHHKERIQIILYIIGNFW